MAANGVLVPFGIASRHGVEKGLEFFRDVRSLTAKDLVDYLVGSSGRMNWNCPE